MKKLASQSITVKVSPNTMEKMKEFYEDKKRDKTPPYAVFQASELDSTITLYESGKALFQGTGADIDANMWIETEKHLNPNKPVEIKKSGEKKKTTTEKNFLYYKSTIGSDEVGTGDYFGPIVVTSSYVTKEDITFLESLGVRDSKVIDDNHILKIVPQIIKKIPYSCMIFSNKEYNDKYSENINLNSIKAILHNKVLLNLTSKYNDYDYVVVDQFTYPNTYYNYLKQIPNVQRNITFTTKAEDKCLSVAVASIISRYVFLKEMEKLSKIYNTTFPKGASSKVDEFGALLVKKHGIDVLNNVAKVNYKNTEKIKNLLKENNIN